MTKETVGDLRVIRFGSEEDRSGKERSRHSGNQSESWVVVEVLFRSLENRLRSHP